MYVIRNHQRYGQTDGRTDGRTSSDPMTATLLKHVAVKIMGLVQRCQLQYLFHVMIHLCALYKPCMCPIIQQMTTQ